MSDNFISIIIPTRNRATYLIDAINGIYQNEFPLNQFEVLVIDNGSTDETASLCLNLKDKYSNLKYFIETQNGLHYGRHKGLKESKGEILIFIDDDVIVSLHWLKTYLDIFARDPKIVLAGGNNLPQYEGEVPAWEDSLWKKNEYGKFLSEYSLIHFTIPAQEFSPYFVFGCNFAIRKQFLLECKGFHPDGFAKENILLRGDGESYISEQVETLGLKAFFHPDAFIYHRIPGERLKESYLISRHYAQGVSFSFASLRKLKKKKLGIVGYWVMLFNYHIGSLEATHIPTILFRNMRIAFFGGAIAHLKAYNKQESLKKWVHKEDYLESQN